MQAGMYKPTELDFVIQGRTDLNRLRWWGRTFCCFIYMGTPVPTGFPTWVHLCAINLFTCNTRSKINWFVIIITWLRFTKNDITTEKLFSKKVFMTHIGKKIKLIVACSYGLALQQYNIIIRNLRIMWQKIENYTVRFV